MGTDLHAAARLGDTDKVQALIRGSDKACDLVNAADKHRRTPLHLACYFGKTSTADALLNARADFGLEANDGCLASHFAAQQGHKEVLQLLVRAASQGGPGSVVEFLSRAMKGKKSALHVAVAKGHAECAEFLASEVDRHLKGHGGVCESELQMEHQRRMEAGGPTREGKRNRDLVSEHTSEAKRSHVTAMHGRLIVNSQEASDLGVSSLGPFRFSLVAVMVEGVKTYPPGVAELADIHWSELPRTALASHSPVLSLLRQEVRQTEGHRALNLVTRTSSYKFAAYSKDNPDGLLSAPARCVALGALLLIETSDGQLLVRCRLGQEPWKLISSDILEQEFVAQLQGKLQREFALALDKDVSSASVLAVMESRISGRDEVLFHTVLKLSADDLRMRCPRSELEFVHVRDTKSCASVTSLEEIEGEEADLLRRSVQLVARLGCSSEAS